MARYFVVLMLLVTGCTSPISVLRDHSAPETESRRVTAVLEAHSKKRYSALVTIYNESDQALALSPTMFRLEGSPPSQFVRSERVWFFQPGYRMPASVPAGNMAQGEIHFELKGTPQPTGPVGLVVTLPEGDHRFTFEFF